MDPDAIDEGSKCEKDMGTSSVDYLPHEVVELILSKCPVKSVIRFKSISKSWQSTISGPRFSEILQSKLSENLKHKFFMWQWLRPARGVLNLVSLGEDGKFRREAVSGFPSPEFFPECSCNGLVLLRSDFKRYILWNPFVGKHIEVPPFNPATHPQAFRDWRPEWHPSRFDVWVSDLYYDSTTDDYKILLVYKDRYTLYSCKNESWDMRGLPTDFTFFDCKHRRYEYGDGCIYLNWIDGIEYFDTRDAKMGKLRLPDGVESLINIQLREVSGHLCLHKLSQNHRRLELWMLEKNGSLENYSWRRLISMEKEKAGPFDIRPTCLSNEGLVVLRSGTRVEECECDAKFKCFAYNPCQNSFEKDDYSWFGSYLAYSETLYMSN